jgi:hypothetical protein
VTLIKPHRTCHSQSHRTLVSKLIPFIETTNLGSSYKLTQDAEGGFFLKKTLMGLKPSHTDAEGGNERG